jgi:hypothetical protein
MSGSVDVGKPGTLGLGVRDPDRARLTASLAGVTLIASCITHDFVIQVSDRRLVNAYTGKVREEEATKAVQFARHAIWGYTGLAALDGVKTDYWILERLDKSPRDTLERLAADAAGAVSRGGLSRRLSCHAFVGVGWMRPKQGPPIPTLFVVSNSVADDGNWTPQAGKVFTQLVFRLGPDLPFHLHIAGQTIPPPELNQLRRNIRRAHGHGPQAVSRLLVDAVQQLARTNPLVGDRLLVGVIPKWASDVDGAGYTLPLQPFGAPLRPGQVDDPSEPTFFYVPGSGSEELTLYGPHWTDGNMRIASPTVALGPAASRRAAEAKTRGPIKRPYRPDLYRR